MTWQKAPEIPGDQAEKIRGGTHSTQICLTQEMINDYGVLLPQSHGNCKVANRTMSGEKVTGDYVCTGLMEGKGLLESDWTDKGHGTGKVHFKGTFQVGAEKQPIEWTSVTTSSFKSSSCGLVKPKVLPK